MKKEIHIGDGQTSIIIDDMKGVPGEMKKFAITLTNEHGYVHTGYMTLIGLETLGIEVNEYFKEFMTRENV